MSIRVIATVGVAVAAAFALTVPAADAAGGPPPPTSTNGNKVELVASGLKTPTSFAFGDGQVFVGDGGDSEGSGPPNGGVYVLKNGTAKLIPSALKFVAGVTWHAGRLYVSGAALTSTGPSWRLVSWGGWNGKTFTDRRRLFTGPAGFDGFNGVAFGANGRLFVGVDVGLTDGNDHGPRSTSPYVYDILSFRPDGSDLRVFAKGMRQPWQMAFRPGSNVPFVTDLGQDSGAATPYDFVLHVQAGKDYGFPKCIRTCAAYAKPFRTFGPHTDLMGIAVQGTQLYLSSFLGRHGSGPGGEVFTLSTDGGPLKTLMKGFVAPTVGLGMSGDYVYVGELTGQVFRLKV